MPNNCPPLSLSLFWRFNFQTTYLPPTSYVCVFTIPANNQPASQSATRKIRHADVPSLRPATLINAHHRLTTLPPSPFLALLRARLSLAPSFLLFPPLIRFSRVSFVPDAPFALHNFSIALQIVI